MRKLIFTIIITFLFSGSVLAEESTITESGGLFEYRSWPHQIFYTYASTWDGKYKNELPPTVKLIRDFIIEATKMEVNTLGYTHPAKSQNAYMLVKVEDEGWLEQILPVGVAGMALTQDGFPIMIINPYMSSELLDRTVAHEFFHLIQFTYDPSFDGAYDELNFSEGTATWMERLLFEFERYNYDKDYLTYYPTYYANTNLSLYGTNTNNKAFQYSTVLWAIYLEDTYKRDIIREIWEEYFAEVLINKNYYSALYNATDSALRKYDSSIEKAYRGFAGWIYDKEGQHRRDIEYYPDVPTHKIDKFSSLYEFGGENVAPHVLGSVFLEFDVSEGDFYLDFYGASDAKWSIDFYSHGTGTPYKSVGSGIVPIGQGNKTFKLPEKYIGNDLVAIISPIDSIQIDTVSKPFAYFYPFNISARFEDGAENEIETTDTSKSKDECDNAEYSDYYDVCLKCGPNTRAASLECFCKVGYEWIDVSNKDSGCILRDSSSNSLGDIEAESGSSFSDISDSHKFKDAIEYVKANNIVGGYDDGTYKPGNKINRAEFIKIITTTIFGKREDWPVVKSWDCFSDVPSGAWYHDYSCKAKTEGIIQGYEGNLFKANNNVIVAEALKIALEAFSFDAQSVAGPWYQKYWDYAKNNTLLLSEWNDPAREITRGEMAELIYRIKSK